MPAVILRLRIIAGVAVDVAVDVAVIKRYGYAIIFFGQTMQISLRERDASISREALTGLM